MKLFLAHCGFYDRESFTGMFEQHVDLLVVADDFADAKVRLKERPEFRRHGLHIDGLMVVEAVDGHRIALQKDDALDGKTLTARTPESWRTMNGR